jgi:hypothetical protein
LTSIGWIVATAAIIAGVEWKLTMSAESNNKLSEVMHWHSAELQAIE